MEQSRSTRVSDQPPEPPPDAAAHDFGSAADSGAPPAAEPVSQPDAGPQVPAIDLGGVEDVSVPHADPVFERLKFAKNFQVKVLVLLLILVGGLVTIDFVHDILRAQNLVASDGRGDLLKDTLPIILPIFTFLMGMGTKGQDDS